MDMQRRGECVCMRTDIGLQCRKEGRQVLKLKDVVGWESLIYTI